MCLLLPVHLHDAASDKGISNSLDLFPCRQLRFEVSASSLRPLHAGLLHPSRRELDGQVW